MKISDLIQLLEEISDKEKEICLGIAEDFQEKGSPIAVYCKNDKCYITADVNIDELLKMSDVEMYNFIDAASSWEDYGIEECMNYLCKHYDIPDKDELGEWIPGDEKLEAVKKAIIEEHGAL